jgi:hypothetical protein
MKKFAPAILTATSVLALVKNTFAQQAQQPNRIPVQVGPPAVGINPAAGIGTILSNALTIIFVAAALAVLFFLVIGAFKWIISGGDKEAVAGARKTIVAALVGLAILALSFLIVVVVGQILNIDILNLRFIPSLDACPNGGKLDPTSGNCVSVTAPPR